MSERRYSPDDLPPLGQEHYKVAKSFSGEFTRKEFFEKYQEMFPDRALGSLLPTDFAYNNTQPEPRYPPFLEIVDKAIYRFVGLNHDLDRPRRNPNWARDELILATEFYRKHAPAIPGKADDRLIKLSDEIRTLARALGMHGDETFRNANGVYMKLMELRKYDPEYKGKGLGRSPRPVEQEVWNLPPDRLVAAANAIRSSLEDISEGFLHVEGVTDADEPEISEAAEGALVSRIHRYRERDRKIVAEKKKAFAKKHGRLFCEACGFDFKQTYGDRGKGFIECHHTVPVSEMGDGAKTKIADLALVCANCHRMIHAKRPWLTVGELREILTSG